MITIKKEGKYYRARHTEYIKPNEYYTLCDEYCGCDACCDYVFAHACLEEIEEINKNGL